MWALAPRPGSWTPSPRPRWLEWKHCDRPIAAEPLGPRSGPPASPAPGKAPAEPGTAQRPFWGLSQFANIGSTFYSFLIRVIIMEDRRTPRRHCVERPKGLAGTAGLPTRGAAGGPSAAGSARAPLPRPSLRELHAPPRGGGGSAARREEGEARRRPPARGAAAPASRPPGAPPTLRAERLPVGGLPPRRGPAARAGPGAQPGPSPRAREAGPRIGAGGDGKRPRAGGGRGGRGGARGCAVSSARGAVRAAGRAAAVGAEPGRPGPGGLAESRHGAARGRGPSPRARPGRRVAGRGRRAAAVGAAPAPARRPPGRRW